MKKNSIVFFILSACLVVVPKIVAEEASLTPKLRKEIRQELRQNKKEIKEVKKNLIQATAKITDGEITTLSGTTLTIVNNGKTYTVLTDESTQFRRRFWGKPRIAEFAVGQHVNIFGKFTDDTKATIQARLIRNISIQKRHGVFIGKILSKTADSFVIKSLNRGSQTVTVSLSTKYVGRNEVPFTFADLAVGHKVRTKGVWDKTNNTITEVTHIKDFSLPLKSTATP